MLTFETKRNEILKAIGSTEYCRTQEESRLYALRDKVRDFARIRGNDLPENEVSDIAKTLDGALMRYYDGLPLKEIELALEWGMVTGESIRLTVHNMLREVAKYLNSDERRAAFALAAKDRNGERLQLTEQEVRLRDFEALRDELLLSWNGYLPGGRLEPYRLSKRETSKDGWRGDALDALKVSQRHIYAGCYAWLKTYGVVKDDEETRRREGICLRNARKEGATAVETYAEALMLEWVFSDALKGGRDLGREVERAAGLTTEIVRMNTPLRHLKTN